MNHTEAASPPLMLPPCATSWCALMLCRTQCDRSLCRSLPRPSASCMLQTLPPVCDTPLEPPIPCTRHLPNHLSAHHRSWSRCALGANSRSASSVAASTYAVRRVTQPTDRSLCCATLPHTECVCLAATQDAMPPHRAALEGPAATQPGQAAAARAAAAAAVPAKIIPQMQNTHSHTAPVSPASGRFSSVNVSTQGPTHAAVCFRRHFVA
eukprot:XP_001689872.1 predicted protein [Chlamydomonas reinhardtii]